MEERTRKEVDVDVTGKSKRERGGRRGRVREPEPVKEGLTTLAHCCVLAFVLLILYLCFKEPVEFFTWHPILLSLGWMLLASESILVISKENPLSKKLKISHDLSITLHWILSVVGGALVTAGFLVITINKVRLGKFHYTSWHGLLGLLGVISYLIPCINGIFLYFRRELRDYMNGNIVKIVHIGTGALCFIFGGISLILSVYTKWFARRTDGSYYLFFLGFVTAAFPVVWVSQRPLIKCVKSIQRLFAADD